MFSARDKDDNTWEKLFVVFDNLIFIRTVKNDKNGDSFEYTQAEDGCYNLIGGIEVCVQNGYISSISGATVYKRQNISNQKCGTTTQTWKRTCCSSHQKHQLILQNHRKPRKKRMCGTKVSGNWNKTICKQKRRALTTWCPPFVSTAGWCSANKRIPFLHSSVELF